MSKSGSAARRIGHIYEDLVGLAGQVYAETARGTVVAWVDDAGSVMCQWSGTPDVPASWLVGTFQTGSLISDIMEDLRFVLRERAKDWILR